MQRILRSYHPDYKAGQSLTIGDSLPMTVAKVEDVTKPGDFPTFNITAEATTPEAKPKPRRNRRK